jgi:hypothetical protein
MGCTKNLIKMHVLFSAGFFLSRREYRHCVTVNKKERKKENCISLCQYIINTVFVHLCVDCLNCINALIGKASVSKKMVLVFV